jgi:CRISPR-associated endonuclease/helicase Cas3
MTAFYAHTYPGDRTKERWQHMKTHALGVAQKASEHASAFGEQTRAGLAGTLHDVGKYGSRFQARLEGKESGLDHWSVGAYFALKYYQDPALALCIQGHHIGLQRGDAQSLGEFSLDSLVQNGSRLTEAPPEETNVKLLVERMRADGIALPGRYLKATPNLSTAADMLDTRMLFSALVDADYLDTEEAMRRDEAAPRPDGEVLDAARALAALETHLAKLEKQKDVPAETRALRADLMNACRSAGNADERLWTLTAPTGSGKTLAMLLFALARAAKLQASGQPIRRIVVVLPFLSILDQTADEYRKVFREPGFQDAFVLEHHSLTGLRTDETKQGQDDGEAEQPGAEARRLVQNWDAPIVITTSVQLLESLHANRPGACRKLHRLARSVILLDEVQTLPTALAVPTLQALSRLTHEKYGAVVVMATATQPAFDTLSEKVKEAGNAGWQPREMAPRDLKLFERVKRVTSVWKLETPVSFDTVAGWIRGEKQVLCIVNMRKHALELAQKLKDIEGLRHISTYLCPTHRRNIMQEVRAALESGAPMRVVATQCVEAGVDLDFPKVFRALGPLDAIAQAAGRCNRHNKRPDGGELRVFLPDDESYPTPAYKRAAQLALTMFREGGLNLDEPDTYRRFYERLWHFETTDLDALREAIVRQDYPEVARLYRLIPDDSVNVVVPYGHGKELIQEARQLGITRFWMKQAQPYAVSVFRTRDGRLPPHLEPVSYHARRGTLPEQVPDWYICPYPEAYDETLFGYLPDGGGADPFTSY